MKRLLLRADDLGYCEAINFAIEKTVLQGPIRTVGLMPNMAAARHGFERINNHVICLGQHTNISVGRPVSDPRDIPTLVDEHGAFISSQLYNRQHYDDQVNSDELVIEIEAQLKRFRDITGRDPDYFEGHAILSPKFFTVLEWVADKHNLKYSGFSPDGSPMRVGLNLARVAPMHNSKPDYDAFATLRETVEQCRHDMPSIFVAHPGYVDAYLLAHSSLTINRTKDADMLCDPKTQSWLDEQPVSLITYRDIE